MKERPILFNAQMVNAILDGRKTQTRRVINHQPEDHIEYCTNSKGRHFADDFENDLVYFNSPYGVAGDRLYVRESFSRHVIPSGEPYYYPEDRLRECVDHDYGFHFWADGEPKFGDWETPKPSIHMPRAISRISLEVTDVRVERLNDISEEDAVAEGIKYYYAGLFKDYSQPGDIGISSATASFETLWESINGQGSWDLNPWVWVVEFKVINQ